ncbi:MAG: prepilin-type N-terminal cleavage/methylation domain-containing protein [Ruminococcus sp.]|nr:prepilin-type N-terminal cleavage/methylation domain-containing protein [Ruminococcus sp.]
MRKTFKGFTLVECLVAMAILAIAGTLMAEIYATVSTRNNANNFMNTSLANQMKYIEQYEQTDTVKIASTHSGTTPPSGTNSGTTAYVKVTNPTTNYEYSFPVDIYVMYSRDKDSKGSNDADYGGVASSFSMDGGSEKQGNLRYKYILGHN